MPAAAVIPAPLAYTNIAAVKTLVVCHRDPGLADGWLVVTRHCWLGQTSVSMFLVPLLDAETLLLKPSSLRVKAIMQSTLAWA